MKLLTNIFQILILISFSSISAQESRNITLLHFSDYHSHALPFYSEGESNVAGVARAIAYLKPFSRQPDALIFSGGDMINRGSPAWSDKYQYTEWSWFNGIIHAMAFGNHDADYGPEAFKKAREKIDYPILGSNVLDASGTPFFQRNGKSYEIFQIGDIKIGVFAVVGPDFNQLLKPETMPAPQITFANRITTARHIVTTLKNIEKVNAIVVIGHAHYKDDVILAQQVPGIDLIFGSHSHREEELRLINGTETYIISPGQYLTHISQVIFEFEAGKLVNTHGELKRMDASLPEDPVIAARVGSMEIELKDDPNYAHLYKTLGSTNVELSTSGQFDGESVLGNLVCDIVCEAAMTHGTILTSSGFRQSVAPGIIMVQDMLTALPYKNNVHIFDLTGRQIQELLNFSVSHQNSDHFSQVGGIQFSIYSNQARDIQILSIPGDLSSGYIPIHNDQVYRIATSNYQALYASGYKDIFSGLPQVVTEIDIWDEFRKYISQESPLEVELDGRIRRISIENQITADSNVHPRSNRWIIIAIGLVALIGGLLL